MACYRGSFTFTTITNGKKKNCVAGPSVWLMNELVTFTCKVMGISVLIYEISPYEQSGDFNILVPW
jgi:hypothetical protein